MTTLNKKMREQLAKILFWQLFIIISFSFLAALSLNMEKGKWLLIGGISYWIPTAIFLFRVSRYTGAQAATRFMLAFFTGEIVKLFLSGVLFLLAVNYLSLDVLYGMMGLIGAVAAFWVASFSLLLSGVVRG